MRSYKIIGLTGQSGSGKSTVALVMKKYGCEIIDADKLARKAVEKGSTCLLQLQSVFGNDIVDNDGDLIRSELAKRAFSSPEKTQLLNSITHPWIIAQTLREIKKFADMGKRNIVFDAPLLFESNMDAVCDEIIAVVAPESVRLSRILKRDGISENEARLRIKSQKDQDYYTKNADHIIDGTDSIAVIDSKVREIL